MKRSFFDELIKDQGAKGNLVPLKSFVPEGDKARFMALCAENKTTASQVIAKFVARALREDELKKARRARSTQGQDRKGSEGGR